ncbi:hypothetical protein ACFSHT_24890 [Paraburkholderia silviterrae]|uniref:Peptidase M41-like protein n=1 Tax=Paraburkholderia silviterrae TaxID=2528715 RepID=A0A4R5MCS9_9BURK|nr:hypothetical protein [Paraburkholderia silviterrae]TDG24179.1 hypothetical protein EYW47_11830 [Paraburkholderia silviterrae]
MFNFESRRAVCFHEAGHAVVHALGGAQIYGLAVAPEGSELWSYEGRKGRAIIDLWGACEPSDAAFISMHLTWDDERLRYLADKAGFREFVTQLAEAPGAEAARAKLSMPEFKRRLRADYTRAVRLQICGLLAGPIAESIYDGREFDLWGGDGWEDPEADMAKADGLARLLHYRGELEYACMVTTVVLRAPEIWARVIALANELERVGYMDDAVADFLPPRLPDWPPPFARKLQATSPA